MNFENKYIPNFVYMIIKKLNTFEFKAYLVGGCVRDVFLHRIPNDWDITTSAFPEDVKAIFTKTFDTGIAHGTVTVYFEKDKTVEVTTFREDSQYSDSRRPDNVIFIDDLFTDLSRRDFTINAIAYHPSEGLIDPFRGMKDIEQRIIRAVGNPIERFSEDALRMLRAIRFATQINFSVETNTFIAIKEKSYLIKKISVERIYSEINKMIMSQNISKLILLKECNLSIYIHDELEQLINNLSTKKNIHHLNNLPPILYIRWAGLFLLANIKSSSAKILLSYLKAPKILIKQVVSIIVLAYHPLPKTTYSFRYLASLYGLDTLNVFLLIQKSINEQKYTLLTTIMKQSICKNSYLTKKTLKINGKLLLDNGYLKGKLIGHILDLLFLFILEKPEINEVDILLLISNELIEKINFE